MSSGGKPKLYAPEVTTGENESIYRQLKRNPVKRKVLSETRREHGTPAPLKEQNSNSWDRPAEGGFKPPELVPR